MDEAGTGNRPPDFCPREGSKGRPTEGWEMYENDSGSCMARTRYDIADGYSPTVVTQRRWAYARRNGERGSPPHKCA
jgi:hypothetical protein